MARRSAPSAAGARSPMARPSSVMAARSTTSRPPPARSRRSRSSRTTRWKTVASSQSSILPTARPTAPRSTLKIAFGSRSGGGWAVRRHDADGRLIMTVRVPASQVTKIAFGGDDLCTAYVTTARTGLTKNDLARQPLAGELFAFRAPRPGLPPTAWASSNDFRRPRRTSGRVPSQFGLQDTRFARPRDRDPQLHGPTLPTEAVLARDHRVSRSVTREAVKMLTAKGLLSARPRQGAVVEPQTR